MAVQKHRRKEKNGKTLLANVVIWSIVLVIFCGASLFFIINYRNNTSENLQMVNYPQKYSEYVDRAAKEYDLEPALIYAVIRTESGFDASAESSVGACGVMQMMPSSFEWLMEKRGTSGQYTTEDLFNPEICIDYGCYLLRLFYDTYEDERCAVAAYNAGFVVGTWLENEEYSSDGKTLTNIPYPETESYVEKVESAKQMYINLYYS